MRAATEQELVVAASRGDHAAFEALVSEHRTLIWAVCLRVTGNQNDAEDALQETLLAAWRGIGSFRGHSRFSTWLYRVASNAAVHQSRKRRDIPSDITDDQVVKPEFTQALADADLIQLALRRLPENFRVAIVLFELCDFTYADIATYQGVGIQTVKSRLSRARQALHAAIRGLDE
ncbi:RNA polymerase sigma factor [Ornithinimicrobium ciconiae]|uniref:RNA polymerase sigma factor n=1 Tax=Ornithinimicrobium ciconiae TaxID=2594265 RepID=UPI00192E00F0|nr:sigma-70 family RNA polymerase sigma factor [Ornithinimicrobium ciconiae]